MIRGDQLQKSKGGVWILKGVDIAVERGRVCSVLGPSGGGKTTLLHALALVDPPDSGVVHIDGDRYELPIKPGAIDQSKLYPRLSMVFQGHFLFPHLTIKENLALPLKELGRDLSALAGLANELNIGHILGKYPHTCSGGEKQRAALARQVLLSPEYLFLDEITSSLDVETIQIVEGIIRRLTASGCGILMVTHSINLARRLADTFCFLDGGLVVEAGSTDALRDPRTERLKQFVRYHD